MKEDNSEEKSFLLLKKTTNHCKIILPAAMDDTGVPTTLLFPTCGQSRIVAFNHSVLCCPLYNLPVEASESRIHDADDIINKKPQM